MVRNLVHDPMALARKSVPATEADREIIADLLDTLAAHADGCVGMAANMIGECKNIIAVSTPFGNMAMINAVIVKRKKPYETEEGCVSLLGGPRKTKRFEEIEVEYLDAGFRKQHRAFSGFTAQIIQHELDHVAGILI